MRISERNRRVAFLVAVKVKNEARELVADRWDEHCAAWAKYLPVSDGEKLRAAAVEQRTDARFQTRWSPNLAQVTGAFRLRFQGFDWRITGVKEIGLREGLEFTAWKIEKPGA